MFSFAPPRRPRRPSLTPMIDVVFLLLVFFMLAARFGHESGLALSTAGSGGAWSGPPRLVGVAPEGVRLNGVAMPRGALIAGLARLTRAPGDAVVVRPRDGATLQRLVDVLEALKQAGHTRLIVVE